MAYKDLIEFLGQLVELVGVTAIVLGAAIATVKFLKAWASDVPLSVSYTTFRQNLGRSILLGLEFLLGGDIIRSIAVAPTIIGVLVLAIIVAIRSFLTVELDMEVTGRWPWQRKEVASSRKKAVA